MNHFTPLKNIRSLLKNIGCALAIFAMSANVHGATTDLATTPLVPLTSVLPNLMFILDDSGSMSWTYMPDDALAFDGKYGYASSQCNGVYYNPDTPYALPVTSTGTNYATPSFTGAWNDGYNTGAGTTNLSTSFQPSSSYSSQAAFYYKYTGTQTSSDPQTNSRLHDYYNTSSTFYTECNASTSGSSYSATITVSGASATTVSQITVNGDKIMSATTSSTSDTDPNVVAGYIRDQINNCTSSRTGNCDVSGFSATASGGVVTITTSSSSYNGKTPSISKSGSMTLTPTTFAVAPALFTKVTVSSTSGDTANGMPADERQNFANWYSYYRSRINMMKSAAGIAFQNIGSNVRVAFMSLNETGSTHNLAFAAFDASQKSSWYSVLYAASPNSSTPLRVALSNAGRIYANKLTSLNGITYTDPIQYSCQKNFTLLSTDGFWNGNAGYKVDGTTAVGNQDGTEPRPYNDGTGITYTKTTTQIQQTQSQITTSTSQLLQTSTAYQTRTSNLQQQTSQLQQCTSYLQKSTGTLQQRTYSGMSWSGWSTVGANTATVTINSASSAVIKDDFSAGGSKIVADKTGGGSSTSNTSTLATYLAAQINACTSSRIGSCDVSGYSAVASGNVVTITGPASVGTTLSWSMDNGSASITKTAFVAGTPTCTWSSTKQCQYSWGSWSNVASCTTSYSTDTTNGTTWTGNGTNCQYSACSSGTGVSSCTPGTPDAGPVYTTSTVTSCPTVVTSAYANTTSDCTATTVPNGSGNTTQCQYASWSSWSTVAAGGSTATITFNTASNAVIKDDLSVGGSKIVANKTGNGSSTSNTSTLATYLAAQINACTTSRTGSCDVSGYSAVASGNVVTISGPASAGATLSWSMDNGSITSTKTAFAANSASCTAAAQSAGPTYTAHPARDCQPNPVTVGVSSCTPSTGVTCATVTTGPSAVSSCTNASASSGNQYTATTCGTSVTVTGVPTTCSTTTVNGSTTSCATSTTTATVSKCTPATASGSNSYKTITCSAPVTSGGTSDTLADVAEYYYVTDLRTSTLSNCTSGSGTGSTLCAAGESQTDKNSYNNVKPSSNTDTANWQHMTTFTLGLGARGSMAYGSSNYLSDSSGDFYSVLMGSTADSTASPAVCSWQANGSTCTWPVPVSNTKTAIDDLWHAAVNGRGIYYSAADTNTLSSSLNDLLNKITGIGHSIAAPALSSTSIVAGDNFMFASTFDTSDWSGDLARQQIDPGTGAIIVDSSGTPIQDWNAQGMLDINTSRTIYVYDSLNANGNYLKSFLYTNLTSAEQNYFKVANISTTPPSGTTKLTQFCTTTTSGITCLISGNQTDTTAGGANLVNYLRGDRTYEGASNDNTKFYRMRSHLLGDIANSEAVYVDAPSLYYSDAGYGAFKAAKAARQPMVYVGANDGMLHAFYAYGGDGGDGNDPVQRMDANGLVVASGGTQVTGGNEAWAFIPTAVMPKLFTLADKNYSTKHQFFVDGTPVTGDVCTSNCTTASAVWKTILVGGLNEGGKGYYALDITNPAAPKYLWEFNTTNSAPYGDANLGYTYGKPQIGKLKDGTWVVMATSGYNNADGVGRLYVLNAGTGAIIRTISTGVGSATTPSGLAQISAAVSASGNKDNTVVQAYGGDLLGNVWRFDVNGDVGATGYDAQLMASLKSSGGIVQPITTRPEVGLVTDSGGVKRVVVYVGTGKYLGNNNGVSPYGDAGNTDQQTMYAIKDPLSTTTTSSTAVYSNPRTADNFVQQTMTATTCPAGTPASICVSGDVVRTGTNTTVDFATNSGWYIDLPAGTGERVNTDPQLVSGTLIFNTNVPQTTACTDGASYTYFLDYRSGAPIIPAGASANTVIGKKIGDVGASRVQAFQLENGTTLTEYGTSDGKTPATTVLPKNVLTGSTAKRTSWRELINDQ